MKYIYSLLFSIVCVSASGQFRLQVGYGAGVPRQEMSANIKPLHSLTSSLLYQFPGVFSRIQAGIDFGWGTYANTRKEQTFRFGNGTSTRTWVNYSSNVLRAGLAGKVFLLQKKGLMPYASGNAGYTSFYSNIFIEDPLDIDGCTALDQRNLIKDGTITAGYGGGLQIDWSLFKTTNFKGRNFIDISVNTIRGRSIDYINTKRLIDAGSPPVDSDGKPLNVQFINATTREIHEHQVAEVYTTPLRMLEFKISAVFCL